MRQAPSYLFRDRMTVQKYVQDGPRRRSYSEGREVRCHWEGEMFLLSNEGRKRHFRAATVWVPRWAVEERRYEHTVEVWAPARVGQRLGAAAAPIPSDSLQIPAEGFVVEERHRLVTERTRPGAAFNVEDRVIYKNVIYQITEVLEWDAPTGPNHYVLTVMDQRMV